VKERRRVRPLLDGHVTAHAHESDSEFSESSDRNVDRSSALGSGGAEDEAEGLGDGFEADESSDGGRVGELG
jgi:hypothetical protein